MSNPITFNETDFRIQFPAFADTTKYPSTMLLIWWNEVGCWIQDGGAGAVLQGDCTVVAMNLMLAHFLTLADAAKKGKTGGQSGFKVSAGIDKVSVSYLAPPATTQFEWWLNNTPYGAQLAAFLEMKAVGGTSLGGLPERNAFRKVGGVFL